LLAQKKVNTDRVIADSDTFKEGKQVDRDIQDVDADDDDDDDDDDDGDDDADADAGAGADDDNDEKTAILTRTEEMTRQTIPIRSHR
jgi:hypothetical protein